MTFLELALPALVVMALVMFVLWLIQNRTHDAGTEDVAWAFSATGGELWLRIQPTKQATKMAQPRTNSVRGCSTGCSRTTRYPIQNPLGLL